MSFWFWSHGKKKPRLVTCRDCTKNKTTGSGNESCVWRIHPGYQKESASWTSDERKRNGINKWSMWSVKKFYGLFVDAWNKGNRLRSARRRHAPINKISRTEITHWMASPFEDWLNFIKNRYIWKECCQCFLLTSANGREKRRWLSRVNWPWGQ